MNDTGHVESRTDLAHKVCVESAGGASVMVNVVDRHLETLRPREQQEPE